MIEYDNILLRFNTKWQNDPEGRKWRVVINDIEHLASEVHIHAKARTVEKEVNGEPKFHLFCIGTVQWSGDVASIHPIKEPNVFNMKTTM